MAMRTAWATRNIAAVQDGGQRTDKMEANEEGGGAVESRSGLHKVLGDAFF